MWLGPRGRTACLAPRLQNEQWPLLVMTLLISQECFPGTKDHIVYNQEALRISSYLLKDMFVLFVWVCSSCSSPEKFKDIFAPGIGPDSRWMARGISIFPKLNPNLAWRGQRNQYPQRILWIIRRSRFLEGLWIGTNNGKIVKEYGFPTVHIPNQKEGLQISLCCQGYSC